MTIQNIYFNDRAFVGTNEKQIKNEEVVYKYNIKKQLWFWKNEGIDWQPAVDVAVIVLCMNMMGRYKKHIEQLKQKDMADIMRDKYFKDIKANEQRKLNKNE